MSITYEQAIRHILRGIGGLGKTRTLILSYFDEDEHGNAGRALDEMVVAGDVTYDKVFYRINARSRADR